jgi:hypothetical protein
MGGATKFKIEFFVIRVGEWGGHMLAECDDPLTIHKFCSMLPALYSRCARWSVSRAQSGANWK